MVKSGLLKDDQDSIKDLVGPMGSSQYTYGYQYPLGWESSEIIQSYPASGTAKASVRIQGFQNGSVGSIDLWLRLNSYALGDSPTSVIQTEGTIMSKQLMLKMRNIEILYAGQVIWSSPDDTDLLFSLAEFPVNNAYSSTTYNNDAVTATNPPEVINTVNYFYHAQLSQFNETFFSNLVQSGVNLTNNSIEIRFNTPELSEVFDIIPTWDGTSSTVAIPTFKLYANINYQAGILVSKGAAQTTFAPPIPVLASTMSF